jgi:predicted pyridoxine 5'-phosphate oxidase superfamily flavin-nucleotide-binding protein
MIRLTEEIRTAIDGAFADGVPIAVAAVDADGQPSITFRGTTQVLDEDRLVMWARNPQGGLVCSIAANPKIALLYRNPATRTAYLFHGRAHVTDDPALVAQIYDRSPEAERTRDPERLGVAILVELDSVIQRGEVLMER